MFTPRLSIRTSSAEASPSPSPVPVHDLLDHTWHYDCVVSPTYSSAAPSFSSSSSSSASSGAAAAVSSQHYPDMITISSSATNRLDLAPRPPPISSQYVSLSSFLDNASAAACSPSFRSSTQFSPVNFAHPFPSSDSAPSAASASSSSITSSSSSSLSSSSGSNCRGKERRKSQSDSSQFSLSGFLAVDY